MSDLSALQPTIFFATCTLKGLIWIPWYLLPATCFQISKKFASQAPEEPDDLADEYGHDYNSAASVQDEQQLLEDHHVLLMERICHLTNIFALVGMISFYAVNPRLWNYRYYGWLLLALLLLQHIPQQICHEGFCASVLGSGEIEPEDLIAGKDDDEYIDAVLTGEVATTTPGIAATLYINRIFSTMGVICVLIYSVYWGFGATLERLAAEPLWVFLTLLTILLETHVVALSVWVYSVSHLSTAMSLRARQIICGCLYLLIVAGGIYHQRVHKTQAKRLRKQLKTLNSTPKMKFV